MIMYLDTECLCPIKGNQKLDIGRLAWMDESYFKTPNHNGILHAGKIAPNAPELLDDITP